MKPALFIPAAALLLLAAAPVSAQTPATACIQCHGNPDLFDSTQVAQVQHFLAGIHAEVGISCQDCHGGNPDPALAEDGDAAMDPGYAPNPFRGAPKRTAIPDFCGRCHSDPTFMKKFKPDPRVDQETEYWTSVHGKRLSQGDVNVATCVDCHGVHGILRINNTEAPVFPTHVAETCGRCHADPQHMKGYTRDDGSPLPVDQLDRWKRSVHANALLVKEDLSAPTCNDCHGNHGATPPGVESVAYVCGQCHGREADLFRASPKHTAFEEHNQYLKDAGGEGCRSCHDAPEPQAAVGIRSFTECTTCHDNHAIIRPTVALLGSLPETPCAFCHESVDPLIETVAEPGRILHHYIEVRDGLLAAADSLHLSGGDRFDWLVDRALTLSTHTVAGSGAEGKTPELRPTFSRLFSKFRIGKTSFAYFDPASGQEVHAPVMNCRRCHGSPDVAPSEPVGFRTSQTFLNDMRALTSRTARAERIILAAQRGGVEVQDGLAELDKAVDSQIQLEVLVHTFDAGDSSAFATKHREGVDHAEAALAAGTGALHELAMRRRGLVISLAFIALTLLGLGLRIRHNSRGGAALSEE